jgi:sugar O-acyltransferase (sialic acid O-acetyltransferase NeuD family)
MPATKKDKLIIWGTGGHALVVAEIVQHQGTHEIVGFVDDVRPDRREFLGVRVIRERHRLSGVLREGVKEIIVAIGDCSARMQLAAEAEKMGFCLHTAIHPRAVVSPTATIGVGTVIAAGAVVCASAVLGKNVIVNTCASVDHECVIRDGAHICPGVHLAGQVVVGRGTWVGIGAAVIDGIRIGDGAFIGAGSVVVKNIPGHVLATGVPARPVHKLKRNSK